MQGNFYPEIYLVNTENAAKRIEGNDTAVRSFKRKTYRSQI